MNPTKPLLALLLASTIAACTVYEQKAAETQTGSQQTAGGNETNTGSNASGTGNDNTAADNASGTGNDNTAADNASGTGNDNTAADNQSGTGNDNTAANNQSETDNSNTAADNASGTVNNDKAADNQSGTGNDNTAGNTQSGDSQAPKPEPKFDRRDNDAKYQTLKGGRNSETPAVPPTDSSMAVFQGYANFKKMGGDHYDALIDLTADFKDDTGVEQDMIRGELSAFRNVTQSRAADSSVKVTLTETEISSVNRFSLPIAGEVTIQPNDTLSLQGSLDGTIQGASPDDQSPAYIYGDFTPNDNVDGNTYEDGFDVTDLGFAAEKQQQP